MRQRFKVIDRLLAEAAANEPRVIQPGETVARWVVTRQLHRGRVFWSPWIYRETFATQAEAAEALDDFISRVSYNALDDVGLVGLDVAEVPCRRLARRRGSELFEPVNRGVIA